MNRQSYKNELKAYSADGSYAVIKNNKEQVLFFCDQFDWRTLWYYYNENRLIISTSQRAVVAMKGCFNLNSIQKRSKVGE